MVNCFFTLDGPIGIHRADFLKILVNSLDTSTNIHFSKRLINYKETTKKKVILEFADGTTAETDVMIGCDGIRSATRASMYNHAAERESDIYYAKEYLKHVYPTWTGNITYRAAFPAERLRNIHPDHSALTDQLQVTLNFEYSAVLSNQLTLRHAVLGKKQGEFL